MRRVFSLSRRVGLVSVALAASGCLIELNPAFVTDEQGTSEGGTDMNIAMDAPESDMGDMGDMGDCMHPCEFAGETFDCVEGQCVVNMEIELREDADVWEKNPAQNYGMEELLVVADDDDLGVRHVFVALGQLGEVPTEAEVLRADLYVYVSTEGGPIDLYRVEEAWSEDLITWNDIPLVDGIPFATSSLQLGDNVIDLVPHRASWADSPTFAISMQAKLKDSMWLHASEHADGMGPRLSLSFRW